MDLGSFIHWRKATDVPDGLTNQGRDAELSSGGLPRPGRDKDGDADALFQLTFPGYCNHFGGGKPPPPTVPPIQNASPIEGTKRQGPRHRTVRKGSGTKEVSEGGGGVEGEHGEGL